MIPHLYISSMLPLIIAAIAIAFPILGKASAEENRSQTVIVDGYGLDVPTASQNAAQNALTQVVGSFINANQMLKHETEIRDGVHSQVQNITENIKEYSQGSIKTFEIIRVRQENTMTIVTAKVEVRIEELQSYFKEILGGERKIDGTGLFAQAALKSKQYANKTDIFFENILLPLAGDVITFDISEPMPYDNNEEINEIVVKMASVYGSENIFIFDVTAKMDDAYLQRARRNLEGIARVTDKIKGSIEFIDHYAVNNSGSMQQLGKIIKPEDFIVVFHDGDSSRLIADYEKQSNAPWFHNLNSFPYDIYVVGDVQSLIKEKKDISAALFKYPGVIARPLIVEFSDGNGNVLQSEMVQQAQSHVMPARAVTLYSDYTEKAMKGPAWKMYGGVMDENNSMPSWYGIGILEQRRFKLVVAMDQKIISKIEKILLKLGKN